MYTIYHCGGDTEVFERPDGTKDKNEFVFTGFGNGIHPYHRKQLNWLREMLKSAGIVLDVIEVPTVYQLSKNIDKGHLELSDLNIHFGGIALAEGVDTLYILYQDVEMGRGWALLIKKTAYKDEIIMQEHRDTVRDNMLTKKWLNAQGVQFQKKKVKNLDKL